MSAGRVLAVTALAAVAVAAFLLLREPGSTADPRGASVERIEVQSDAVGRTQPVSVVVSPDAPEGDRPALVFLHGRGGDDESELDGAFFDALAELGERAPVVAFPDGGDSSY